MKFEIQADIPEQEFMESCLNMRHSGFEKQYILLGVSFYALSHTWHYDKLIHYLKLLELK